MTDNSSAPAYPVQIGENAYHKDIYDGKEIMEVVGIRKDEVELQGDYSGGMEKVIQSSWMPISGLLKPKSV